MNLLIFLCFFGIAVERARSVYGLQHTLVFSDEFNRGSIDTKKWNVLNKNGEVNQELEYYSKDDVYVSGGNMVIRSQKRPVNGRQYTSGMVDTKDKFNFLYGEVEWRAKLPRGAGIWPALWLVHFQCQASTACKIWPPEIDLMEARGDQPNKITNTLHYGRYPNNHYSTSPFVGPDFTAGFHTFKVIWDPNQVTFFVDGKQTYSITDKAQIPTERMHLIMNVAVGGWYSGNPDGSTQFPAYMNIDYVRVYRWQ